MRIFRKRTLEHCIDGNGQVRARLVQGTWLDETMQVRPAKLAIPHSRLPGVDTSEQIVTRYRQRILVGVTTGTIEPDFGCHKRRGTSQGSIHMRLIGANKGRYTKIGEHRM